MKTEIGRRLLLPAGLLLAWHGAVQAQAVQDAGSLLRDTEKALEQRRLPQAVPAPPAKEAPGTQVAGAKVTVKGFTLKGVSLVPEADILAALAPWVGKPASFADLRRAADAVSEIYRSRGFLVRAYLPEQDLTEGIVTIAVIEGRLGSLRIDRIAEAGHVGDGTIRKFMLARQKIGEPVLPDELQRAISLVNDLPGIAASSVLEPGEREGESRLAVALRDTPGFAGAVQLDNAGAKVSGENRLTVNGTFNSPLRIGDQVQAVGNKSEGSSFGRLAYSLPLGADGLRVGLSLSNLSYGYGVHSVRYSGDAQDYGLQATYPILRSNERNLSLAAAYDRKDFKNSVGGVELNNKSIAVGSLTLSGDQLDALLGGGLTQYAAGYAVGNLDLAANATDLAADQGAGGPRRHGQFERLTWSLARLQRLTPVDALAVSLSGQVASRNLDSSEKFVATGPAAVRAYASTEASGDEGALLSIEWRHQFGDRLQAVAFFDQAHVRRDRDSNTSTLRPNGYDLSGAGFGINWGQASDLAIRASVAWRLGSNPARNPATGLDADGTRRDPRVWVTALRTF